MHLTPPRVARIDGPRPSGHYNPATHPTHDALPRPVRNPTSAPANRLLGPDKNRAPRRCSPQTSGSPKRRYRNSNPALKSPNIRHTRRHATLRRRRAPACAWINQSLRSTPNFHSLPTAPAHGTPARINPAPPPLCASLEGRNPASITVKHNQSPFL
jgi:hypothetical protein